jgi:ABC-type lipoprotein export system ATPase subunit
MTLFDNLHAHGLTVITVTHDPLVAKHAERIITLSDGKIVADEYNGHKLKSYYLASEEANNENY